MVTYKTILLFFRRINVIPEVSTWIFIEWPAHLMLHNFTKELHFQMLGGWDCRGWWRMLCLTYMRDC